MSNIFYATSTNIFIRYLWLVDFIFVVMDPKKSILLEKINIKSLEFLFENATTVYQPDSKNIITT